MSQRSKPRDFIFRKTPEETRRVMGDIHTANFLTVKYTQQISRQVNNEREVTCS